ncbi:hypothetical protein LTS08_002924 [Lithohypha guttulata]|uniref:MARVEL domain-containing protein n=1 Tax=Lithohypha guttulata TaxID=1690604 RepID=A0AAN7SZP9_9EURO|nr:hypothetical protein LTR51_000422 [Lithohypha guttulata]KAK5085611.1 hypothetical protein LTR05_004898 [Lithohypha guttulata]KAK5103509.1 hypothetical protein LTS08_002924 [Lithohypha guttulata]
MALGGALLRFGGLFIRILQFCVSDRNISILNKWLAVEGMTGAATLYALLACVFILFLGGKSFFGYLGAFLDILFVGCFAAVAYYTREGTNSCNGFVRTPLGDGDSASSTLGGYGSDGFGAGSGENLTYASSLHTACIFNRVVFACAIIAIFLFLLSAVWQILMVRHHKKEKKFGPSPSNNYTSGTGKTPFWKRGRRNKNRHTKDAETVGAMTAMPHGTAVRPSHETSTTLGNNTHYPEPKYGEQGYGHVRSGSPVYGEPGYGQNHSAIGQGQHMHQAPTPGLNQGTFHDRTTADGRF